jgi:4-amino-4-deoxy-L-arabinose transferase-like glycosyltransferase
VIPISRISHRVAVPVLLAVLAVGGLVSLAGDSATFDETAHLGAAVSYAETGDFRLNPEHPPLAKWVAALPLAVARRGGGAYDTAAWTGAPVGGGDPRRSHASQWQFGFDLLNGPKSAPPRNPAARLVPARCAILVLGLLLVLCVYAWSRELHGPAAGLLALALAATSPTILAHARLVTTDLPAALGFTATMWLTWRWLRAPSLLRAASAGGALAAALLFKFSCLILAPVVLVLALAAVVTRRVALRQAAAGAAVIAAIAYAGLWAGYGFRFAASRDAGYVLEWQALASESAPSPAIAVARDHRLLPEAYLYGFAYARAESFNRVSFLDGEQSLAGWYRYFPEAFLWKTPIAFTVLAAWAIFAGARRARALDWDGWCVAAAPGAFTVVAVVSRFNIGHRHLVPVYPFLCVAIGPVASWLEARGARAIAAAALVGSCVVSFALATPSYLSYFNVAAGGPRGGARHLVDSNLDWGQDLARLAAWMRAHGVDSVDLAYFGTADPRAYGISFRKVALFLDFYPELPAVRPEPDRILAVSATFLAGAYLDTDRALARELLRRGSIAREKVEAYLADAVARRARGLPIVHLDRWVSERGLVDGDRLRDAEADLSATSIARVRDTEAPIAWAGESIAIYRVGPSGGP